MFSVQQKRDISDAVQKILRATAHPELPTTGEIGFNLHVEGAEDWSYADIRNNGAVGDPGLNPHNELMASMPEEEARGLIEKAQAHEIKQTIGDAAMPGEQSILPSVPHMVARIEGLVDRVTKLEDEDKIHRKLYSELRFGLDKLQDFLMPIIEDNLPQHHDDKIRELEERAAQIESVAEDRAKDVGQLRSLVDDLNNATGSIQDQVNDVADEVKKIIIGR